jgi:hypothetical protein
LTNSEKKTDQQGRKSTKTVPESGFMLFFRDHSLSLIIFLFSFFFIIAISNPALYVNDEWISANQLHQLDIGHQVTFNEGKYGVTQNGTVSAYFTSRQNILMYSLFFPLLALPVVKLFGLFGDNFRLFVILIWSLSLILIALLIDMFHPEFSRIRKIRIFFPVVFLAILLFMGNVLLYKQFPFSAPDAPFEVAALVLTNHLLFSLMITVVFETFQLILKDKYLSLFGTFACISCSSYIFWAAAAKDHVLTTVVLAFLIFFFVRYLTYGGTLDVTLSFVCSGLLIWVRPEVGFFVTIFSGLFFSISFFPKFFRNEINLPQFFRSLTPLAGVIFGGIPFFINNILITHNLLIPVFDLPRATGVTGSVVAAPLSHPQVIISPVDINQTADLNFFATVSRLGDMVSHAMLSGFTEGNLWQGFIGMMTFPENDSIGYFIICPIFFIAIITFLLWNKKILGKTNDKNYFLFFFVIILIAVFFSYITRFSSMNTSHGVLPDMRYLSPSYIPAGLFSILVLSKTPFLSKSAELLKNSITGMIIIVPLLILLMIVFHPFGNTNAGYFLFFEFLILCEIVLCSIFIVASHYCRNNYRFVLQVIPVLLILMIFTVLSFQIMLNSIYAMVEKFNGYPFWIPLIREGFSRLFTVNYLPPV